MGNQKSQNKVLTGEVNLPKKAIVALLLAFAMLMCAPVLAFADTAKELKTGQEVTASANSSFFKYTASKDGRVAFVTGNDDSTYSYITLYKYKNQTGKIDYSYNQGWSSPYNSRIIYKMKAGQTVYLSCQSSEGNTTWSYPVEVISDDHNLALARPYYRKGGIETVGTDSNGLPVFDLCLKSSKGEKHLVQNKDFKIDSFKAVSLDSGEDTDGVWTKNKPSESGSYLVKFVGTGNYKGSIVAEISFYVDKDGSYSDVYARGSEYSQWSNENSSTRSDVYATTANGNYVQNDDFLNNPLASVAAWIDGAWKTLTAGTDYEFSKDDITATDDSNWFQATIKGIGDWTNKLETSFLFQTCKHDLVEHQAVNADCSKGTGDENESNIHYWKCKNCGLYFSDANAQHIVSYDDVFFPTYHKWGDWKVTTKATCETRGEEERTCQVCGKKESQGIDRTDHNVKSWTVTKQPTYCSWWSDNDGDGVKTGTCTVCGQTVTENFGKDHTWSNWTIDEGNKPTCTSSGYEERKCSSCGRTESREVAPLGKEHTWGDWVVDQQATCNGKGSKHRTCTVCGETDTETIKKLSHAWNDGEITEQPTCNKIGIKTFTCKDCGVTKTEGIPNNDVHTWDAGKVTEKATCSKAGTKTYTCTKCGETKTEAIAKSDHSWDAGTVTKAATCSEPGTKTITCSVCKATKTESIAATGKHTYDAGTVTKAATCTENGVKTYTCTTCKKATKTEAIKATGHKYGEWKTVKAAAENVKGSEERTCSVCGNKETRDIAALPIKTGTTVAAAGATVTVASNTPTKTPSGAQAAGSVTYKKPSNTSATTVTVPSTIKVQDKTYVVTKLDTNAFKNNKKVKTVKLPSTITQVNSSAFSGCTALKSVSLPSATTIGSSAFSGAKNLTSVTTGSKLKTIGSSAFSGAKKLKTITITSKSLSKKGVKGSLKGSSVKTVKVKVGSKKVNKSYVKKYKAYFSKSNAGKKASVK